MEKPVNLLAAQADETIKVEKVEEVETAEKTAQNKTIAIAQQMSAEEFLKVEKRLKRKLDSRLMAPIVFIYILNYLDRNNIAAAKIAGLETSLKMTATQYSTAVSILFVGYVLMQVPSNIFLAQLRPSLYLPACMVAWGIISTCTAAVRSASGLYAVRFLLGIVESAYYPGSLFMISSFYKRSELGLRSSILYAGAQIGSAFSGLIAAGITQGLNGAMGIEAWRWIFLIEGSITVFVAILAFFILPDWPSTTKWLTPAERAVAEWRLIKDAGQVDEDHGSWQVGFKAAFSDWRLYVFAAMFMCNMVATSTQNFFPSVVGTLGYGRITTLLLTAPPYLVGALVSITNNWSADRRANASFHVMWPLAVVTVGFVTGAATLNTGGRYFAMYLMIAGGHGANAVIVSWCQKTLLRPRIKRAAAVAFVNCFGNIAQVYAAYFYPNQDAPRYAMAMALNSGFAVVGILLAVFMRVILVRANKKIAAGDDVAQVMRGSAEHEIEGISDEERLARKQGFRYVA